MAMRDSRYQVVMATRDSRYQVVMATRDLIQLLLPDILSGLGDPRYHIAEVGIGPSKVSDCRSS